MVTGRASSTPLAIVPVGPFAIDGAPTALDARAARLSLAWPTLRPLCCARGADVDVRARLQLLPVVAVRWASGVPRQHDPAPSGVVERLADVEWRLAGDAGTACAALADPSGGVHGEGCALRAGARAIDLPEDAWLLDGCALFPLELRDGALVPSSRIPDDARSDATDGAPTLWELARPRVAVRWGEPVARAIDEAASALRAHRAHGLHLKTFK